MTSRSMAAEARPRPRAALVVLPADLVRVVLGFLGLTDVAAFARTSKGYFALVEGSGRLWAALLERAWRGKFIMPRFRSLPRSKETLKASLLQSKETTMSEQDLHSILWRVQFYQHAGGFFFHRTRGKVLLRRFAPGGVYWHPENDPIFSDASFDPPHFTWETYHDTEDGSQIVQLSGMPPHYLTRDPNTWEWKLDSAYTYYRTVAE